MQQRALRGFSLIELLVVITIIGILSTVIVVSINDARNRSVDSSVKENLHTVRNQAELYHSNRGTYGTAAATASVTNGPTYNATGANFIIADRQANEAFDEAIDQGGQSYYAIGVSGQSWAVAVRMRAPVTTSYWCIDSQGTGKTITSTSLGGGAAVAVCP